MVVVFPMFFCLYNKLTSLLYVTEFVKLRLEPFNFLFLKGTPRVTKLEVLKAPFRFTGFINCIPLEMESVLFTILLDVVLKLRLAATNLKVRILNVLYPAVRL